MQLYVPHVWLQLLEIRLALCSSEIYREALLGTVWLTEIGVHLHLVVYIFVMHRQRQPFLTFHLFNLFNLRPR